jgi:two-component system response regulator HydG
MTTTTAKRVTPKLAQLALLELSDSFHAVWGDLAEELGLELVWVESGAAPPPEAMALLVAAGGDEEAALDALAALPRGPAVAVLLVGAEPSHRFAVEAMRRGAADYFALPGDLAVLRRTLSARAEARRARTERGDAESGDPFAELLGESPALMVVLDAARRVAPHGSVTVLIQGETGTGKELLARALHDGSPRRGGPFVAVNCAAIPRELMESELFGHERGAFTDAHAAKPGLFEEGHGGTLFLDEIGHLPLPLQGKLLRALDDRRIRRVGGTHTRDLDVRVVAATHVDLHAAVADGEFREDLYYRLNVVTLTLPPLRARGSDVVLLARYFAERLAERYGLPVPAVATEAIAALETQPWPGNVRELRHAVERALLLSPPGTLASEHLRSRPPVREAAGPGVLPFPARMAEIISAAARATVERSGGNKAAAARSLGISRARLQRLLDREEPDE